jgi:excisionase family DNA binding protein
VSISHIEDERSRAVRLARQRKQRRARLERRQARREAAIRSGGAPTVSPREFSELSGVSLATVYRFVYNGKLKFKKLGWRTLIYADQLTS